MLLAMKPVRLGANSIYTRTENENGAGSASEAAYKRMVHSFRLGKSAARNAAKFARRGKEEAQFAQALFPEVPTPQHNYAYVAVGAIYAIFVEFGTHKMAARPFFYPAVAAAKPGFLTAMERVEFELK